MGRNEPLKSGYRLINVELRNVFILDELSIWMKNSTSGGKESESLHNRMDALRLVKIKSTELQWVMRVFHNLILRAFFTAALDDFRLCFAVKILLAVFFIVKLNDCWLNVDKFPNSVRGWIGFCCVEVSVDVPLLPLKLSFLVLVIWKSKNKPFEFTSRLSRVAGPPLL